MKQNQKNEIKNMEYGLKDRYESVNQKRAYEVKIIKAGQIKEEIQRISAKDYEAKRLEKAEETLIKRLKETHLLQQETLSQIQDVFAYENEQALLNNRKTRQIPKFHTAQPRGMSQTQGEAIFSEDLSS